MVFSKLGKAFIPAKWRPYIKDYFTRAGIPAVPYSMFGVLFMILIFLTLVAYALYAYPLIRNISVQYPMPYRSLVLMGLTFASFAITALGLSYIGMSCIYIWLDLRIFKRTNQMESVLVDYLQFVSENLKAGMSFDRALFFSIKPQFKVLATEVSIASKRAMTGEDIEDALSDIGKRYESHTLSRSFAIIIEGIKGGGEIAAVIDRVVDNLRETKKIKEEMNAATLGYVIFISFIVTTVAPALFALSSLLLKILCRFFEQMSGKVTGGEGVGGMPLQFGKCAMPESDFVTFASVMLGVTAIFTSIIISQIQRGNIKSGLRYIPVFIVASLLVFHLFRLILKTMLGALFTF